MSLLFTDSAFIQNLSNFIVQIALGKEPCLHTVNLSTVIDFSGEKVALRDLVRLIFAELGIDIEFSGKDQHEKSVIIDVDEDRIIELNLNQDVLRFGQTVVRADANELTSAVIEKETKHNSAQQRYSVNELIKEAVNISLGL